MELLRISLGASTIRLGASQDLLESYESYESYDGPKSKANQAKFSQNQTKSKSSQIKIEIKSRSKSNKLLGDQKSYESNPRKSDFRSFFSARGWPLSLATGHWAWPLPWPLSHWGGHSRSRGKARAERWPRNEVLRFIAFLDLNLDFLGFPRISIRIPSGF